MATAAFAGAALLLVEQMGFPPAPDVVTRFRETVDVTTGGGTVRYGVVNLWEALARGLE